MRIRLSPTSKECASVYFVTSGFLISRYQVFIFEPDFKHLIELNYIKLNELVIWTKLYV